MELQADCFAGCGDTRQLEKGDVEEGLGAASAVGDDRIQRAATGRIQPERWTHGSAAERASWFRRGFSGGKLADCDTFAAQ
jgi:predicted metalloprotease